MSWQGARALLQLSASTSPYPGVVLPLLCPQLRQTETQRVKRATGPLAQIKPDPGTHTLFPPHRVPIASLLTLVEHLLPAKCLRHLDSGPRSSTVLHSPRRRCCFSHRALDRARRGGSPEVTRQGLGEGEQRAEIQTQVSVGMESRCPLGMMRGSRCSLCAPPPQHCGRLEPDWAWLWGIPGFAQHPRALLAPCPELPPRPSRGKHRCPLEGSIALVGETVLAALRPSRPFVSLTDEKNRLLGRQR